MTERPAIPTAMPRVDRGSSPTGAIVIVGSAGAIDALIQLLAMLTAKFPLPIIVAQHLSRSSISLLPAILNWHCAVRAKWAEDDEEPQAETVYVVPPARQLQVTERGFKLSALRPDASGWLTSPDALLHSVAARYGARSVGIVLSGMLTVGIGGFRAIKSVGGITFAQNQASSQFFDMPRSATDLGKADMIYSPANIAAALNVLAEQRAQ